MATPIEWEPRTHARLMARVAAVPPQHAAERWPDLVAAHVLGLGRWQSHADVHLWMLRTAWAERDADEMVGQLWRLALLPLAHLSGLLPWGNTGRSDVTVWRKMPVPEAVQQRIDAARRP
ncbi:MAG: hypothetical protein RJA98_847 [Pseudomonadota bacterium]|jgi:hypothetical protein